MNIKRYKQYIYIIAKNWKNVYWWYEYMVRYLLIPILFIKNNGMYIWDREWDNLIILDACRYDVFKEYFFKRKMVGKLEYILSRASDTPSFLIENFFKYGKEKYDDIVYITANPFVDIILKNKVYKIIPVWKHGWSEHYQTVLPKTMYEYTIRAIKKYPGKRFIIHFIQPHYPYLLSPLIETSLKDLRTCLLQGKIFVETEKKRSLSALYGAEVYSIIEPRRHFRLYKQNLEITLPYVEKLIEILPGKTVVTADHGEAFGEILHPLFPIRIYGHIGKVRISPLIKVPWLVIDSKDKEYINRKKIRKEIFILNKKFRQQTREVKKLKKAIKSLKLKGKI